MPSSQSSNQTITVARGSWEDLNGRLVESTAEIDVLRAACGRLLRAYEAEETEHGFPFSFELRSAHRALKAHMDGDY
jgi:hypothetical protein